MSDFRDRIKTIGALRLKGTMREKKVINQDTGKVAGTQTEHWSDRVDANVYAETVRAKLKTED